MSQHINEFNDLIDSFNGKDFKISNPTLLELSGYHHYENGISNILAFYLADDTRHGFSTTFTSSLLNLYGADLKLNDSEELSPESISREVSTDQGNYIDLVIETSSYKICIENKINAVLDNPLQEYKEYIEKRLEGKTPVYILLTANKAKYAPAELYSFKHITYKQFFKEIDIQLESLKKKPEEKYIGYYKDLKQVIMGRELSDDLHKFLKDNTDSLEKLKKQVFDKYDSVVKRKLGVLVERIGTEDFDADLKIKKNRLEGVVFFTPKKHVFWKAEEMNFKLKVRLRPENWFIELWDQGTHKSSRLKPLLEELNFAFDKNDIYGPKSDSMDYSFICQKFDFQESPVEVADKITEQFIEPLIAYINR